MFRPFGYTRALAVEGVLCAHGKVTIPKVHELLH